MYEEKLTGKTLLVYMYLLNKNRVTAREVKDALGLSSTSLAIYYLERLCQMDLADKEPGGHYVLKKKVDIGIYSFYVGLYGFYLPKFLPYAIFFTVLLISYIYFYLDSINLFALFALISTSIIFWYETLKLYFKLKSLYKGRIKR
ncbi:MAG: hypothetical protein RQ952_01010 [Thermoproteota archaeon]|jgi:hypothetical protein|nr:hypothetical protein [Thermoproteota archaeon]